MRIKLTWIPTKGTKSDPGTGNAPTLVAAAPAETIQLFAILLLSFSSFPKSKSLDFSSKIASIASCKSVKFSPVLEDIGITRSEEHTSERQSRGHLVCRLLLENKKYRYL